MDEVFIERLWRSVKYEDIYLKEYAGIPDLRAELREWFERYNMWRPQAALGNQTPFRYAPRPMGPSISAAKNRSTGLSICSDTRLRLYGHTTQATIA
jgi:hypothetical protein